MVACDKCWQGRHVRCGGRGGCSCTVCTPTSRSVSRTRNRNPKDEYKQKYLNQKPTKFEPPTATADDVRATIRVLQEMPSILDHLRIWSQMSFEQIASSLGVSPSMIRGVVVGRAPQGMTTKSLLAVLPFAAEQLDGESPTR